MEPSKAENQSFVSWFFRGLFDNIKFVFSHVGI